MTRTSETNPIRHRLFGLDSIRFVCASIVLIGHYGFPFKLRPESAPEFARFFNLLTDRLFNGPAAVIVFFIISGLCIHFPYRNKSAVATTPFFTKRLIRIGLPAIAAILVWRMFGLIPEPPEFHVFWSIICEIVYYLLYPVLLFLGRKTGWGKMILISYLISIAVAAANLEKLAAAENSYTALGLWTWAIGLPCWLMGCWLAENFEKFPKLSRLQMWGIRSVVFAISVILRTVKFYFDSPAASNCFTLNAFAFLACAWIGCEVAYFMQHRPYKTLEWAGTWSYSLYIIHPVAPLVLATMIALPEDAPSTILITTLFALLISYAFFRIIELPTHKLAKASGQRLKDR